MRLRPYFILTAGLILCLSASIALGQACTACGSTGGPGQCYSVVTGIVGNTGCAPNIYGGCDYYGGQCGNGQQGPPSPSAWCIFVNPNDSACQPQIDYKDYTLQACIPSLKNELLGVTPLPGRSIRLIRTRDGQLVRFEHAL
jgi:hypothetical protein